MSAVDRRGAPEPRRPSRNPDFKPRLKRPLARPRRPVSTSTCLPDGSRSTHKRPIYVSFVNKAILWERGICHYTVHDRPDHRPTLCPRFLSHMNASPDNLRAPCFLSSRSRLQPLSQGNTHTPTGPQTHTLEAYFHLNPDIRRNVPTENLITGRHSAVVVPCLPLPATPPPSSTFYQTPPQQNTLHTGSGGQLTKPNNVPTTPSDPHSNPTLLHPTEEKDEVKEGEPNPESDQKLLLGPSCEPEFTASSVYSVSQGSLSDFSRPPSSLFSRSTDLASGRSSFLSADFRESDPEDGAHFSALQSRLATESPFAPFPLVESNLRQSPTNTPTTRPLYKPVFGQTKPLTPSPTTGVLPQADKPLSRCESTNTTENLQQNASVDPGTLAFPSATWSSCPSPQSSTPRSGSGPNLTPSASVTRLESQRWSVLPPISPVRGRGGSAASRYSELSCSQSDAFDELEAIAPRSASSPSLDRLSDSSAFPSPVKELSPGLAALTVGCDSGNLGSLSRVQLLLLDRMDMGHSGQELSPVEDWFDPHYDPASFSSGVLRPLTAGSISERCDSTGQNKSDHSEGGSGSPSSWIIDQSPSPDMFRTKSNHSSSTEEGGPTEEESNYPGSRAHSGASAGVERPGSVDCITEENDRTMEERKTQVLNMLSKLQDNTPRLPNTHKGCSNFEEFDFLAKYCIFSQEKLAEYKRAFEAEDSDGDGYISCLQVLLALKDIIPPELLSEEEEIYVYRILEMVDFRVTDGLVDLRLFAVIASLAQKIATMDEFMRSLISDMDFRSLEVRLFKAKQLFLFLLEEQRGEPLAQGGFISAEQLLLELKAGGIHLEQEAAVRLELQHIPPLDLLDYLAYLPLFMLIHKSVISNPLDDSSHL